MQQPYQQHPGDVKSLIRIEYQNYDINRAKAEEYLYLVRQKVYSSEWETKEGTLPGKEMVRILCTAPGVGEITTFTWLAFADTPRLVPNAKALSVYCSLDPSNMISAGKVTSTKKRKGCRTLHAILVSSSDKIIRAHSEAFGRWGYLMSNSSGKWGKTTNAVIFNIPIDELPALNRDFKRYIRILHENDIHTTADMITAYLSCSIGDIKGLGRKFYITLKDFISHQRRYQEDYKKLHETANAAWEATVS